MLKKAIAIIPARGGSTRVPRKNIRPFYGKPIIAYTIEAALKAECFDRVIVSTEDEEIAEVSRQYGAEVPFLRSAQNARGEVNLNVVLREVLDRLGVETLSYEFIGFLMPCAPFLRSHYLQSALNTIKESDDDAVISVVEHPSPIERALQVKDGSLQLVFPEVKLHSQFLPISYADAGQLYILRTQRFLETEAIFMPKTKPFCLPEFEVQDIDTESDWKNAEIKFAFLKSLQSAECTP